MLWNSPLRSVNQILEVIKSSDRDGQTELTLACNQQIQVRVFQIEPLAEVEIGQCTFKKIDATAEMQFMPD